MTFESVLNYIVLAVVLAPIVVLVTYFSARAGAFAYFRTKREHIKRVLEDLKNGV